MKLILLFVVLIISQQVVKSQVVCTLEELIREVYEDLSDNGRLDCLRSYDQIDGIVSKEAEWNGDCSFESEGSEDQPDWRTFFVSEYLGKDGAFVDVDGNKASPPFQDFDDQADMCEIVRALVGSGKFSFGKNMNQISLDLLENIDCAGGDGQSQICAATTGSFAEKDKWVILLQGEGMTIDKFPSYEKKN
jgi:hypothetical protein